MEMWSSFHMDTLTLSVMNLLHLSHKGLSIWIMTHMECTRFSLLREKDPKLLCFVARSTLKILGLIPCFNRCQTSCIFQENRDA